MRCPSCNTFVPYDTEVEPEESNSPECNGTDFTASYRRVLTCESCGEELKEAEIELSHDFESEIKEPDKKKVEDDKKNADDKDADDKGEAEKDEDEDEDEDEEHEHAFEVEACDASPTTDVQRTDRNGRAIKSARYMKTLYGVSAHVEVRCECGATAEFDVEDNVQASGMDELV